MSNIALADYNRAGQMFTGANVSGKSVIAVTTSMTGLILYNPVNSGKKLLLTHAGFVWTTAPAAVHNIGIAIMKANAAAPTSLTPAGNSAQALDGSASVGVGICYDAATLPTAPVAVRWIGGNLYQAASAVGTTIAGYQIVDYIDGGIALVPGSAACLTVVTTTAVGMGSFNWVEVPA